MTETVLARCRMPSGEVVLTASTITINTRQLPIRQERSEAMTSTAERDERTLRLKRSNDRADGITDSHDSTLRRLALGHAVTLAVEKANVSASEVVSAAEAFLDFLWGPEPDEEPDSETQAADPPVPGVERAA